MQAIIVFAFMRVLEIECLKSLRHSEKAQNSSKGIVVIFKGLRPLSFQRLGKNIGNRPANFRVGSGLADL